MNSRAQANLPGIGAPDVVDIPGHELDGLIARLAAESKRIIRLDVRNVSGWRCTVGRAPVPAGRAGRSQVSGGRLPGERLNGGATASDGTIAGSVCHGNHQARPLVTQLD